MKVPTAWINPQRYSERPFRVLPRSLVPVFIFLLSGVSAGAQEVQNTDGSGQSAGSESGPFTRYSLDALSGRALFEKLWVAAPASTGASDGLGPYYHARSCAVCHPGGGQGSPLSTAEPLHGNDTDWRSVSGSLVMHVGEQSGRPFGRQLQPRAVPGLEAEVSAIEVRYAPRSVAGSAPLRQPDYRIRPDPGLRSLALSPRLAPDLRGVALLERIPESVLLSRADPQDRDGDGISGRAARNEDGQVSRFGWRGESLDLVDQVGRALFLDMGLGNPEYPAPHGDCGSGQTVCLHLAASTASADRDTEVSATAVDLLVAWLQTLEPSAPEAGLDSRGGQLFLGLGCADCHVPDYEIATGEAPMLIHPHSDLLLHDLGEGLADRDMDGRVHATEWRTAPLWGLGDREHLLHDGRAADITDAILWHGGEARDSRERFLMLPTPERAALLEYLRGL